MKKTLLSLIAGASIGAGTVVTLPDGETATTAAPTAADIYNNEEVGTVKLVQTEEGNAARYIIEKTSSIEGVAPLTVNGLQGDIQSTWDAVSSAAQSACNEDPNCEWTSMDSARSAGDVLTANIKNSGAVTIAEDVPQLDALKAEILAEN